MIIKAATKININGWRKQLVIDTDKKTISTGAFQFHVADVDDLTTKQYNQMIDFFVNQGFNKTEV